MLCRYQQFTLQLLPAGAAVAGWVIILPLEERVLSTARSEFRLKRSSLSQPMVPDLFRSLPARERVMLYDLSLEFQLGGLGEPERRLCGR